VPRRDNTATNGPWFTCLPGCETEVPCGPGWHIVAWEAGSLLLPSHPDAEGELVLAALGGERARCVELAEAWARHADDLSMLAIGPRHPADEIAVGWDEVTAAAQAGPAFMGPRPISGVPARVVPRMSHTGRYDQGPREPKGAAPPGLTSEERARREGGASRAPGGERG
jgi:hypothetical protein